ncbi:MAG TPA: pseudouridine synthase [Polyangiales bacterium]
MVDAASLTVVHRDQHLLVLFKPAGLATTSPDGSGCLASLAREIDPSAPRLHASSRLDADVTGLVTFARTDRAIAQLMAARAGGRYQRFYLGLSAKAPTPERGEWRGAVAKDPRNPRRRIIALEGKAGAVSAHSRYQVVSCSAQVTLLSLLPQTGRTHQLRLHASAAGAPLLGDKHYGGPTRVTLSDGRVVRASRVMLHCARLRLPAIDRDDQLVLDAPVPSDMRDLFAALGGEVDSLDAAAWDR